MNTRSVRLPALLASSLLLLLGASTAYGQEADRGQEQCICLDRTDGPDFRGSVFQLNRARIGILLGAVVETDGGPGVTVEETTDEGPAEAAGLRAGDIITEVDGESLGDRPARGLLEAMADVEPGDTVTLTYYRDGARHTADVVTDERDGLTLFSRSGGGLSFPGGSGQFRLRELPDVADRIRIATPRGFAWSSRSDVELVAMNPGLGEYFGTDQGVLVADIPDDSELGLEPGDVIIAIDGREVRDPGHVHSILASYRADETITFEIVRNERRQEVTATVR